ncbi:conserved hypothetical protein-like protein [Rhizobium leguminosarum bv. trifolii WSM2304]|uniref:UPF0335 protein Rleg2_2455 n=1 Tax=Rhizobium leguminosarum bv. trifolii (strain WSM2304) TaxID=395492 RepID=A0ABF7QP54_RHILW|nr:conserved hypothetical protein-like protein [Rhizobium leguminosarum bv. trifolii WSM2304]
MTDAHGVARDQLRAFIERIERLEEEKKTIADDIKDVYGEAKAMGFIPAMMKKVIAIRKKDEQERAEEEAILDTYLHALGMISQPDFFEDYDGKAGKSNSKSPAMALQSPRKAAEAVSERTAFQVDAPASAEATIEGQPSVTVATSAESAEDERNVEAVGGATLVLTNSESDDDAIAAVNGKAGLANVVDVEPSSSGQIDPNEDRSEGHSLGAERAGANAGGHHVTAQANRAATAGALVKSAPATKPLRPHCRNPGEHCGGYGSNHCHSCLRAAKESEVAA